MNKKNADKFLGKYFWLTEKQTLFLLVIILAASFFLRIYRLDGESLWHDEALTIDMAKKTIPEIITLSSTADIHPPLHYIMLHFWIQTFGDSEFATRFLSVIFGVLSIYIIYRIGEITFNKEVGILSSIILSISLYHIRYSQEVRSYSLLVLMVLLSNYYFIQFLKEKDIKKINLKNKNVLSYIIFTILTIYTHVFGLFYLISQNIYYLSRNKDMIKNIKIWAKVQGIILVIFGPWIYVLIHKIINLENGAGWNIPSPDLNNIYGLFKLFSGSNIELYLFILIAIVGIIIIYGNREKLKSGEMFLLMWLFVPIMISFIISLFSQPIFYDRYVIASLPAFLLLISYAIFNFQRRYVITTSLMIIMLVSVPSISGHYQNNQKEQWREVVKYIEENKKDNDIILIYPQYGLYGFDYYYKNSSLSDIYTINGSYEIKNRISKNSGIWLVNTEYWLKNVAEESKSVERELSKTHEKILLNRKFIDINLDYYKKLNEGIQVLYLYQKNPVDWNIINGGAWGRLKYSITGFDLRYSFEGHNLLPNTYYTLVYTNRSEVQNNSWTYIAEYTSNNNGDINVSDTTNNMVSDTTNNMVSNTISYICYSANNGIIKPNNLSKELIVRLVLTRDYDPYVQKMVKWSLPYYLYEDDTISC